MASRSYLVYRSNFRPCNGITLIAQWYHWGAGFDTWHWHWFFFRIFSFTFIFFQHLWISLNDVLHVPQCPWTSKTSQRVWNILVLKVQNIFFWSFTSALMSHNIHNISLRVLDCLKFIDIFLKFYKIHNVTGAIKYLWIIFEGLQDSQKGPKYFFWRFTSFLCPKTFNTFVNDFPELLDCLKFLDIFLKFYKIHNVPRALKYLCIIFERLQDSQKVQMFFLKYYQVCNCSHSF